MHMLRPNIFGRAIAGLSYLRFKAIRHKLHCQLPSNKPLVMGRKGWIQRALSEMLAAEKAGQPNTSKPSTQDHIKIEKEMFILTHSSYI